MEAISFTYMADRNKVFVYRCTHLSHEPLPQEILNAMELTTIIDEAVKSMPANLRIFIVRTFLDPNESPDWYLEFCSRSTYYRLLRKAILYFLNCLGI